MGFYLPGIGEAIGAGLAMNYQNKLLDQYKTVLQDESRPYSERIATITAVHPELLNHPQIKTMLEVGRQADADKMARAKFDREEAERKSVDTFKGVLAELDPEARVRVMRDNPDKAAVAFPEEWGLIKDTDKAAADREEMLMLENGRNARSAASINARREATQATLAATAAKPVPETPEQRQARAVETAGLKAEQEAAAKKGAINAAQEEFAAGLSEYRDILKTEGRTGGFGVDEAELASLRQTLGVKLAQMDNPGRAPTDADIKVAMERIPEPGVFTSPTSAVAQVERLLKDVKGFKRSETPPPPPGFKVIP